jgi:hypothetical protein
MKPYLISIEIERLQTKIDLLLKEKRELIEKTIEECEHPLAAIRERPYVPASTSYGTSQPPYLVCTACGLSEKGWGCGYKKLRHAENKNVKQITTKEWGEVSLRIYNDE